MTPAIRNNKHIYISWVLSTVTLIVFGLAARAWNGVEDKLTEVSMTVSEIHQSLDSLRYTVDKSNLLDSLQTSDIRTMRFWLHRHNDITGVTFLFPEANKR